MAVGVPQGEAQRGVAAGPLYAWGIARSMRGARSTAIMRCTTCAHHTSGITPRLKAVVVP
jgi:hypothetical protein